MYRAQAAVIKLVEELGIGTNLRLHDAMLMVMSGGLVASQGALIPALSEAGLDQNECLRTWQGIATGSWQGNALLSKLKEVVKREGEWQALEIGGYRVKAMDTTAIYRPRLQNCESKHFESQAGRALPAIKFGLLGSIGSIKAQRVTLPELMVRGDEQAASEEALMQQLAQQAVAFLEENDGVTADRKFPVLALIEAGVKQVVVRRAKNLTLRRCQPTPKPGRGRPAKLGQLIRPLPRSYQGRPLAASVPDEMSSWQETTEHGEVRTLEVQLWHEVVLTEQKAWSPEQKQLNRQTSWTALVIKHPDFVDPMLILMNVKLTPQQSYAIVRARWGIEQPPLVSKQLLGARRMFVHAPEMRFRLPELVFVAGALLTYLAASCEPMPSGWWDTQPRPTAGRLRRQLAKLPSLALLPRPSQLRKKRSPTHHLPRGFHPAIAAARKIHKNVMAT